VRICEPRNIEGAEVAMPALFPISFVDHTRPEQFYTDPHTTACQLRVWQKEVTTNMAPLKISRPTDGLPFTECDVGSGAVDRKRGQTISQYLQPMWYADYHHNNASLNVQPKAEYLVLRLAFYFLEHIVVHPLLSVSEAGI
jgi:hypothetical protein